MKRTLRVTWRIFAELKNDKRTLALIFIAPIFAMFIFGFAFGGEVSDVTVTVVNNDKGMEQPGEQVVSLSDEIVENLDKDVVDVSYEDTQEKAAEKVEDGKSYAVIEFPENFTYDVMKKSVEPNYSGDTTIDLMLDKSNVNVANAIVKTVNEALLETMEQQGRDPVITVDTDDAIYGKNAKFIDFFVPGVMAFAVFLLTTLLTLVSFVSERTGGTLDRMLSTPLSEGNIVLGYSMAFSVTGILQSALLLIIAIAVFRITIVGNVVLAFAVVALLAVVSQALGILLSSLARRESQVIQFFPFIVLPAFLLAGVFWPLEAIPAWLRPVSYLVPPTYAVSAIRSVMLRGWGIGKIWPNVLVLLAFAVVFMGGATWWLKVRKS